MRNKPADKTVPGWRWCIPDWSEKPVEQLMLDARLFGDEEAIWVTHRALRRIDIGKRF